MSTETITFANFAPEVHNIYDIGATEDRLGVIPEMAEVFKHTLAPEPDSENLGVLIGKVGKSKELQENLPRVQEVLGTDQDALNIARGWVENSGLLVPVERSLMDSTLPLPEFEDNAMLLMSGGVRNWMQRRAKVAIGLAERGIAQHAVISLGNRPMKEVEGTDVVDGMTEADYGQKVIAPMLMKAGINVMTLRVDSADGNEVMRAAAEQLNEATCPEQPIIVVGNAGAGIQLAGQLRQAFVPIAEAEGYKFDREGDELYIATDGFPLGVTGQEPTATHQNPFTALGQIARNAKFLADLQGV